MVEALYQPVKSTAISFKLIKQCYCVAANSQPLVYQHSVSQSSTSIHIYTFYLWKFFLWYWGLNSGNAPETLHQLFIFVCGYFQDRVLWTICRLTLNQNTKCKCTTHPNLKKQRFSGWIKKKLLTIFYLHKSHIKCKDTIR
jgi:hypothetical protein